MTAILIVGCIWALSLVVVAVLCATAKPGWEDENGFHYGTKGR